MHGEVIADGRTLKLSLASKSQNRIRTTIQAPSGQATVTVFFNIDAIIVEENAPGGRSVRELSGSEAAAHLLDLLSLNPEYHFRPVDGFDLGHPLLEGFSLEILRAATVESAGKPPPIEEIRLIEHSGGNDQTIRTIRYLKHSTDQVHGYVPQTIEFTDNTTGEGGIIEVTNYSYNAGLPDFLFEAPSVMPEK
jgi:hypothetical protein